MRDRTSSVTTCTILRAGYIHTFAQLALGGGSGGKFVSSHMLGPDFAAQGISRSIYILDRAKIGKICNSE